jgi:hypothetical protein
LRRTIDISLEKKHLQISYTLFSEPNGGIVMTPLANEKFVLADSFSFGNLLRTSSETYSLQTRVFDEGQPITFICSSYNDNHDNENCFRREEEEGMEFFLKSSDVISTRGIRRTFYIRLFQEVFKKKKKGK